MAAGKASPAKAPVFLPNSVATTEWFLSDGYQQSLIEVASGKVAQETFSLKFDAVQAIY
jgi:hypothetical protein